jgi:hypothetical protein
MSSIIRARCGDMGFPFVDVPAGYQMPAARKDTLACLRPPVVRTYTLGETVPSNCLTQVNSCSLSTLDA